MQTIRITPPHYLATDDLQLTFDQKVTAIIRSCSVATKFLTVDHLKSFLTLENGNIPANPAQHQFDRLCKILGAGID